MGAITTSAQAVIVRSRSAAMDFLNIPVLRDWQSGNKRDVIQVTGESDLVGRRD
jgi:hypothetical protein